MASEKKEHFECRRPANPENTKIQNLRVHLEDFANASMEDHKKCLMNTFNKVFSLGGGSKTQPGPEKEQAANLQQQGPSEVESVLKVRTTSL